MLRLAQGALRLAHPQLRLKQRLLRLHDRNGNLVRWVVAATYRGIYTSTVLKACAGFAS
jgi:ribosomal protein L39E